MTECATRTKLLLMSDAVLSFCPKRYIYGGIAMFVAFIALINIVAMAQVSFQFLLASVVYAHYPARLLAHWSRSLPVSADPFVTVGCQKLTGCLVP